MKEIILSVLFVWLWDLLKVVKIILFYLKLFFLTLSFVNIRQKKFPCTINLLHYAKRKWLNFLNNSYKIIIHLLCINIRCKLFQTRCETRVCVHNSKRAQVNRRKLQTDTQQIRTLQRITGMLMFTHPGENRDTLRSQYEFLCFYVCISFPPEEKSRVWEFEFPRVDILQGWLCFFLCDKTLHCFLNKLQNFN